MKLEGRTPKEEEPGKTILFFLFVFVFCFLFATTVLGLGLQECQSVVEYRSMTVEICTFLLCLGRCRADFVGRSEEDAAS